MPAWRTTPASGTTSPPRPSSQRCKGVGFKGASCASSSRLGPNVPAVAFSQAVAALARTSGALVAPGRSDLGPPSEQVDLTYLDRRELTAFFINIYNALVVHGMVLFGPAESTLKR